MDLSQLKVELEKGRQAQEKSFGKIRATLHQDFEKGRVAQESALQKLASAARRVFSRQRRD